MSSNLYKFLERYKDFNLKLTKFSWTDDFNLNLKDVSLKMSLDQNTYIGRGTDADLETAINKALSECIESNALILNNIKNSNGIAVHYDKFYATKLSIQELIERDNFFSFFLNKKIKCKRIETLNLDFSINRYLIKLEELGIDIKFFQISQSDFEKTVICIGNGLNCKSKFGVIIGLGSSSDIYQSILKSLIETSRNCISRYNKTYNTESISIDSFNKIEKHNLNNHKLLGLDIEYAKIFIKYISSKIDNNCNLINSYSIIKKIKSKELEIDPRFKFLNLKVIQSYCPNMFELSTGHVSNSNQDIFKSRYNHEDLNYEIPHCFY